VSSAPAVVAGTTSTLPFTGSNDTMVLLIIALAFLGSGAAAVGVSRRRAGAHRP
jgi:LPXTG-motif cell wall-anchored protein